MLYIGFNPREITAYEYIRDLEKSPHKALTPEDVRMMLRAPHTSCCAREDKCILDIIRHRFDIDISIPITPFRHSLRRGDRVIIIVVANIRRLEYWDSYTREDLRKARIFFRLYTIQ